MKALRWLPWIVAFGAFAVTIALGNWQTRRAAEREAAQERIDAARSSVARTIASASDVIATEGDLPRRVALSGEFVEALTIYLGNRIVDGVAGFQVLTPVRVAASVPLVLVDRGWTAADPVANSTSAPKGRVVIEGLAVERPPRVLEIGNAPEAASRIWANLDYARFDAAAGSTVARFVVEQSNELPDGLQRARPRIDRSANRNRGYALQWYSLGAMIVALTAFYGARGRRRRGVGSSDGD